MQDDSPTDDEENKFEGLCNRTAISTTEPIGNVEYKSVVYNFYDLHKKTVRFIPRNYGFTKRYSWSYRGWNQATVVTLEVSNLLIHVSSYP